jgi:hypothetical protein
MFGVSLGIMDGAGGAAGGSYESIATATGTGSSGTITFSGIPSTYKHLQIRMIANDGAENNISLRFNSSTSGYSNHTLTGDGSSALASGSAGTNRMSNVGWTSPTTNAMSGTIVDIIDYASTTKNKTVRSFVGRDNNSGNTDSFVRLMSGLWENTSAVTSIELLDAGGSFTTNSVFSLYGIKG